MYEKKTVVKVVGIHALIVGGFAAAATVIHDLLKIYGNADRDG